MESILAILAYYFIPLIIVFLGIFLDKYGYFQNIGFNPKYYWILLGLISFYYLVTLLISYYKDNPDKNDADKYLPTYK
jgi:hypothetical protein